ncbi:hypothetical protein SCHPADRAFT_514777 [Schizopora paradoxa]|uniref:Uncharacterized protein n=1 Tax=Schizopora paradoxa TaxID=27342 RepID=A0A0H2RFC9_9AGAM|nr:hypothetical protein SCHPADRAFT_514777 [Schizopora paradoxa]
MRTTTMFISRTTTDSNQRLRTYGDLKTENLEVWMAQRDGVCVGRMMGCTGWLDVVVDSWMEDAMVDELPDSEIISRTLDTYLVSHTCGVHANFKQQRLEGRPSSNLISYFLFLSIIRSAIPSFTRSLFGIVIFDIVHYAPTETTRFSPEFLLRTFISRVDASRDMMQSYLSDLPYLTNAPDERNFEP